MSKKSRGGGGVSEKSGGGGGSKKSWAQWQMRGRDDLDFFLVKEIVFFIWQKNVPKSSRPCFHHLLSHLFGVSLSATQSLNCLHLQLVPW